MKKLLCSAMAGLSLAASAHTVPLTPTSTGGLSGSFEQQADGSFLDTFSFSPGSLAGEVSISLTEVAGSVNFFTALVNGQGFAFLPEDGKAVFQFNVNVTADQPLQLQVSGFAGDAATLTAMEATYGGSITLSLLSAVPEPASLALMLAGLGLVGVHARRRLLT